MADLTPEQLELIRRLGLIFAPATVKRIDDRYGYPDRAGDARFAHYTSADAALGIIKSKRLWMRNATCMVDFSEMRHGHDILVGLFNENEGALRASLISTFDAIFPGVATDAIQGFDSHQPRIRRDTFIASVSEHPEGKEDLYGRLSMWRAFGAVAGGPRVALVVKIPFFTGAALAMQVQFSPVHYAGPAEIRNHLSTMIQNVRDNQTFLKTLDREVIRATLFGMLLSNVICVKHEAFSEELEWRAYFSPVYPQPPRVEMKRTTRTINDVPQHVYELPLDKEAGAHVAGLDITRVFDRLIIGPTPYPVSVADVLAEALSEAGVQDVEKKIQISGIPIRT
jgi:hypothetical protein